MDFILIHFETDLQSAILGLFFLYRGEYTFFAEKLIHAKFPSNKKYEGMRLTDKLWASAVGNICLQGILYSSVMRSIILK